MQVAVLLHVAIGLGLPQIAKTVAVFVEGVELHLLGQAARDAIAHSGGRNHHIVVGQTAHIATTGVEDLHLGHAVFPPRIARSVVKLHKGWVLEAVGRQHIGQTIFVLRHRAAIDGGTAHVHAFAVDRPRRLHLELHSGLRTGGFLHVGKQAKGLFLRAAVAEIGRNIVATVEHDFGAAGKEAKHLVIITRAQSVAIVCRQSDVTIGRHAVQMLQRGDARRAIRTPHAREVLDYGLAPHRTREGVALAAAHREGVAVGFAVDSHDRHHEIIDPGAGCGRNIYRQRGGVVVGQRLFEF